MFKRNPPIYSKQKNIKNLKEILFLSLITEYKVLLSFIPILYPVAIFLVYLEYLQYGLNILSFLDLSRIFIVSIPTFIILLCFAISIYYFYFIINEFLKKFPQKKYWIFIIFLVSYCIIGAFLISLIFQFITKPNYVFFLFYALIFIIYPIPFAGLIHATKYIRSLHKFSFLVLLPFLLAFAIWLSYSCLMRHYDTVALFSQDNCILNNDKSLKFRELFTTNEYTIFYNQKEKKSTFMKNTDILSKECMKPIINFKEDPNNKNSKDNQDPV